MAKIAAYYAIEKKNRSAARRVIAAIRLASRRAGEDPDLSRLRDDLGPGVRSKVVLKYPYLVFFRRAPKNSGFRVQVIRVLHQSRNVEKALKEGAL